MKKIVINETKNQEVITRQEKKYNVEFASEINNEEIEQRNEIKKEGEGIEYEIGQQGKTKIKLSERDFMYEHNDNIMLKQNQMCLNLSHIYEEKEKEENKAYLGKGWRSNIHQNIKKEAYDEEKGYQKIIYTDGNKKEHIFKEYWYYNDINGNKVYINRKQIYLDSDQKLKYQVDEQHIYEVKNEVKNEEGLNYVSGKNLTSFLKAKRKIKHYYVIYGFGKKEIDIKKITQNLQFYYYDNDIKIYIRPSEVIKSEEGYYCTKEGKIASIEIGYENILVKNEAGNYTYKYLQTDKNTHQINVKSDGVITCEEEQEEDESIEDIYRNEEIQNIDNQIESIKRYVKEIESSKQRATETYKILLKQLNNQVEGYNLKEKVKNHQQTMEEVQEGLKQQQKNLMKI